MSRWFVMTYAALLAGLPTVGWCQSMEELEVDHNLRCDFVTPHTDWAQPYALGKTRVLFFTTGHNTEPRECVELMQRFDLEAEAVFYATIVDSPVTHWHGGAIGEMRMLNLLQQPWDCFVFLGLGLDKMGPEAQYRMLKQVTDGAGLVLSGVDDPRVLKDKNRLVQLPPFLARGPVGEAFTVGKGRGLRLPGRPSIGYYEGWEADYDHWQERLGRAVLWAAGKEPTCQVSLSTPTPELERGQELVVRATVTGQVTGDAPRICGRLAPVGGDGATEVEAAVTPGSVWSWRFAPGSLRAGRYYLDIIVRSTAGVEGWDTVPITVTANRSVAEVKLAQDWGEVGDRIRGTVTLAGPPGAEETLRVRLLDRRRRELVRRDIAPVGSEVDFDLPVEPWMPMLVTVEAQLLSGDQELSRAYQYFRVTRRNRDRWNFLIWDIPTGTLGPYAEESLARTGMTLQLRGGSPPLYVAAFDTAWVPYTTRILASRDANGIMQPFCWNDEQAVQAHVTQLAEANRAARQHGVFVYSLGDENDTLGCCLSPHCATAYRRYLQQTYGSLEALNASWGTDFTSWEQVGLSQPDDNEEASSLQARNYPRWFDRQAFKSYNYVMFCQKHAQAYDQIDPQARTGFEGAGGFQTGDDLDLIVRTLQFWSPYPGTADEVVRSIAPPDFPSANWMGYTKDADSLLAVYWRMVTRGMDAVWWWRWDCIGAFHGWLAPNLDPYPAVKDIIEDTRIVREGLGDLLLRSQMQDDGIALLYSYPSVFAHKLEEGASFGGYESSHVAAHAAIRGLGLQFRYVTDGMLRRGEWDASRYKVLFLVRAEALGDKEARVIRQFVENGGTVIADFRPGLYDDHCKPRPVGVLDDLFGIQRTGSAAARTVSAPGSPWDKALVDPAVEVTGGQAEVTEANASVFIRRQVGKGRAILLNCDLGTFQRCYLAAQPRQEQSTPVSFLREAGVERTIGLHDARGALVPGVEITRWKTGDTELVSFFRTEGVKEELTVSLAEPRHVFDLRTGRDLGTADSFRITVVPSRASFLALCRQDPPPARLDLGTAATAGAERGSVIRARLSVPGAEGLRAFRLRARCGERELEWLSRNVVAGAEPVELELPIAYNDPVGVYEVSARDLFTQREATAALRVR